ncbi:DUF4129 domain-containing protein [Uliginosibacterium aquaticum]|uniref:DUF4129 domain-containing protein n=1 Tax=Uliginosibacterium aquaticum TaxID=2731212 RepID=A0ABX2IRW9_9RHOO|nr:DUF4129 domain-containing protein [Uliginosibacterium aquaticum]NSL57026.1 DUF4129 domain-containing protein [Uliginosibacterium aquaticum]
MDLERLSVTLRPRNHWEAIDLGVRFALSRARPLYAAWFALTLPVLAVLTLIFALWLGEISWVLLIMWWLKPVFDRLALHVVSHAVFGEIPSLRQSLRALPGLLRNSRLLAALTWERFSLTRSIRLPVDQLEGLRGKAGRQRKSLLGRRIGSAATWHTLAWLHLETILWTGLLGLVWLLIPEDLMPAGVTLWKLLTAQPLWFSCLLYLPLLACSLLLEPLYVAGGFMLYLKRRTDLEAWDVELQFRRLAQSHTARSGLASVCIAILLGLLLGVATPSPAEAADSASLRETQISQSGETIKQVMQDPAFGKEETERRLHWRSSDEPKNKDAFKLPDGLRGLFQGLESFFEWIGKAMAMLGRIGSWLLILAALGLLLYLASRFGWLRNSGDAKAPPAELAGFDIRPQSLPDDLASAAHALLAAGDARGALSLLFRGSLSRLAHREQVAFARGDTEGDCLDRTRQQASARAPYLARLLGCWQRLAYAHQVIPPAEIEALCQDWRKHFEEVSRG